VPSTVEEGDVILNYANVTCDEGQYDEITIEVPVKSYPPYTYKKFNGRVINVTIWEDGGAYTVHYILTNTTIELVATDNGSGVAKTFYRIFKWENDGWNILFNWQEYGVWNPFPPYYPINLSALGILYNSSPCGKYEIEFYSIDKSGNVENVEWNDVFVDCFAPSSYITETNVNGRNMEIKAAATDIGIGVEKIELYYRYSPDNITWNNWTYLGIMQNNSFNLSLLPDGYYEFYTVAYDYLGNHEILPNESTNAKAKCTIYYPWDINNDGRVDVMDIYQILIHWMETPASPEWNEKADINNDGVIDVNDIYEIIEHWTG